MGLLSRIGKNFAEQFDQTVPHHRWGETLGLTRQTMSLPQMASTPLSTGALGAGIGGALGAATGGDAGEGAMQGAGLGVAAGALGVAPMMGKRLIVAIAQALKKQRPDMSDEAILDAAIKEAQKNYNDMGNMLLRKGGWRG